MAAVHDALGISRLVSHDRWFEVDGGPSEPIVEEMPRHSRDDFTALADRATFELNRRFAPGGFPVRLFVLPRAEYHYIGRTYQHWVGDAYSMNSLLARVIAEYLGIDAPASLGATARRCPSFREAFAGVMGPHRWCVRAAELAGELVRFRRCHRPSYGRESDLSVRVRFPTVPDDALTRLTAAARRSGVTVNEVVLAALAEAIALQTPERVGDHRRDLALTSVVNVRPLRPAALNDRMGLYLAYFTVMCRGDNARFEDLLSQVHAQSAKAKAGTTYLKAGIELQIAAALWPHIRAERRIEFFSHRKPAAGAVTNIRVPEAWLAGELGEATGGWWRAASAGPMTPLAVSVTTAGKQFTCGIASRASGYAPDAVAKIAAQFVERLGTL